MKTTMQIINYIAKSNFGVIIIKDYGDMTPMQAIEFLSVCLPDEEFNFDSTIEKGQLHIW